jgi:hypothetical protein
MLQGSFRFPGKAVILLPAANWRFICEINKMAASQEKVQFCFWYDDTNSVTVV